MLHVAGSNSLESDNEYIVNLYFHVSSPAYLQYV